jgi:hypothetical protein
MAPEQAAGGSRKVGPAADVYALGAVLYQALTGRPPFRGATAWETLQQVLGTDPVPPTRLRLDVPRDLETVCLKCLSKEPGRRYQTAGELDKELGRFLAGEPVQARPFGPMGRLWRWALRLQRLRAAGELEMGYGVLGTCWTLFAFALVVPTYHAKRPNELFLMFTLVIFLDYVPTLWIGMETRRGRLWAFLVGATLAGVRVTLQFACLFGYSPSFGGIYDDPAVRSIVYALLILMSTTILVAHLLALPAYLERRAHGVEPDFDKSTT